MLFRYATTALLTALATGVVFALLWPDPVPVGPRVVAQDVSVDPTVDDALRRRLEEAEGLLLHQEPARAEALYRQLEQETAEDSVGRGWVCLGLGRTAKDQGRIFEALEQYRRALDIFCLRQDRRGQSVAYHNLGAAFTAVGELELARDSYKDALDARTNDAERAITLSHLATLDDLAGDHALAVEGLTKALALRRSNRAEQEEAQHQGMSTILDRLGSALSELDPHECPPTDCRILAQKAYHSTLELLENLDRPRDRAITNSNLGWLAILDCPSSEGWCQPEKAIDHFEDALGQLGDIRHSDDLTAALQSGLARALRLAGDLPRAEAAAIRGLEAVERQRLETIHRRQLRTTFLARHHPLYDELITILARRDRAEPGAGFALRALGVAEWARGRDLLDRIAARAMDYGSDVQPTMGGNDFLLARMSELEHDRLQRIDRLDCQQRADPGAMADHLREIARLEAEQRRLAGEARAPDLPDTRSLPFGSPFDLVKLRQHLDPETALLVYNLGAEASFLWWIDGERFALRELPPEGTIQKDVQDIHQLLSQSAPLRGEKRRNMEKIAEQLSLDLLGVVSDWLEGSGAPRRLAIFPDGALHTLPWAILPHPANGRPLVAGHALVVLPSFALWEILEVREQARHTVPAWRRPLALVADAVYSPDDPDLRGKVSKEEQLCNSPPTLPGSAREADFLGTLVPAGSYDELRRFAAQRDSVIDGALAGAKIVHLAVHGELNDERPELSHLLLSRFDPEGQPIDARLFAHELANLELDADLVVLSACNSGSGKIVRGEGVLGMTQAVLVGGASRALVSLWSVGDQATAELMSCFYRGLLEDNLSPAAALAQAQRQMLADDEFSDPQAWAGFILVGDWRWQNDGLDDRAPNKDTPPVFSPDKPRAHRRTTSP